MKILVASVTNASVEVLGAHLASVVRQELPPRVTMDLAYISDGLVPEAEKLLAEAGARIAAALPKPTNATYAVTNETHEWSVPTFSWLATEKQRLLDLARDERYDGVFFVDSDLVLGPETLASLIHTQKDVASAVFWTSWQPNSPALPQVWMRHPYEFDGRGVTGEEFLRSLDERALVKVAGLGACTLIRSRVFDRVRWAPLLEGLPSGGMWQGEDRSFCLVAERAHVELWADAWPDIYHIYRPAQVLGVEPWIRRLPERPETPEWGDLVSIALEALEEPALRERREHVRGRLGQVRVLPEIEEALLTMKRGEARAVRVAFPLWWSVDAYRGQTKNVLVRLLDVKRPRNANGV